MFQTRLEMIMPICSRNSLEKNARIWEMGLYFTSPNHRAIQKVGKKGGNQFRDVWTNYGHMRIKNHHRKTMNVLCFTNQTQKVHHALTSDTMETAACPWDPSSKGVQSHPYHFNWSTKQKNSRILSIIYPGCLRMGSKNNGLSNNPHITG